LRRETIIATEREWVRERQCDEFLGCRIWFVKNLRRITITTEWKWVGQRRWNMLFVSCRGKRSASEIEKAWQGKRFRFSHLLDPLDGIDHRRSLERVNVHD
jgi:hypothetical protein